MVNQSLISVPAPPVSPVPEALSAPAERLERFVRSCERRLAWQNIVLWMPRVLCGTGLLALVVGLAGRWWSAWNAETALGLSGLLVGVVVLSLGLFGLVRRRPALVLARQLDAQLQLQERLSTALELLAGRLKVDERLRVAQIASALQLSERLDPRLALPVRWRRGEWLLAGLVLAFVVLSSALLVPVAERQTLDASVQAALEAGQAALESALETVATNPALTPIQREALLEALEEDLQTLRAIPSHPEESFATLSQGAEALEAAAEQAQSQAARNRDALAEAQGALQEALQAQEEAESLAQALQQAQALAQQGNAQQLEALAQALEQLAEQTPLSPELQEALNQAAQALQSGDSPSAQSALEQAQAEAQAQQDAAQAQQAGAEALSSASQQTRSAAQDLAQSEAQSQSASQSQSTQGGSAQNQAGAQGEEAGNQAGNSVGNPSSSQNGGSGEGDGSQGQDSEANTGEQVGGTAGTSKQGLNDQDQGQAFGRSAPAGMDAGEPQADGSKISPNQGEGLGGGAGREWFTPIYSPQNFNPEAGANLNLEANPQEGRSLEGEFGENPTGSASVPYNEVYGEYASIARQALEGEAVPPALRAFVRAYFEGLAP